MPSISPASKKPLSFGKKLLFTLIVFLFFLILIFAAGEIIIRIFNPVAEKPPVPPPYDTAQKDERLGWRMTPDYSFDGIMKDVQGQEYPVSIRYDANGFKAFGDIASARPKVFFIGDSYTASIEVSNEKSFFNLLKDSLGIEVFAYGHAGFGTLQEYMVLDQWVDRIRPDVVVWEVCSNDFIDNYAPLEIRSGYKVGERRPYLRSDGSVEYRVPVSFFQKMQRKSQFLKWLVGRSEQLYMKLTGREKQMAEYYLSTEKRNYQHYDRAVVITEKIIGMIKERLPAGTKVLGFAADIYQPQVNEFKRIFEGNGFYFSKKPGRQLETVAVKQKLPVKSLDGFHWNEKGHEVVAGVLAQELKQLLE